MEELRRFTQYGVKQQGVNNKFYEVEAVEREDGRAEWIFRWGRIGTDGQSKSGVTYSFEAAKQKCEAQFEAKEKRGYKEQNAMEALATAVQDLDERQTNGLPSVEIEVPCFHAGKSEKRCGQFAEKWLDKLNIVRRSRWDLGDAYYKQAQNVLKGYCAEWKRICRTKAHGHLADNANAHTAFRIFFNDLRDNAGVAVYGFFEGVGAW